MIQSQGSSPLEFVFLNWVIPKTIKCNLSSLRRFQNSNFRIFKHRDFLRLQILKVMRPRLSQDCNIEFFQTKLFEI